MAGLLPSSAAEQIGLDQSTQTSVASRSAGASPDFNSAHLTYPISHALFHMPSHTQPRNTRSQVLPHEVQAHPLR